MRLIDILALRRRGAKKPENEEEALIDVHHQLMKFYKCWIPIEELRKTPIPTIAGLLERIREDMRKPEPVPVIILGVAKRGIGQIKTLGRKK